MVDELPKEEPKPEPLKCPRCWVEIEVSEVPSTDKRPKGKTFRCPKCKTECFDGSPPVETPEPSKTSKVKSAKKKAAKGKKKNGK